MKIETIVAVQHNGTMFPPGSVMDLGEVEANRLIRLKAAVEVEQETDESSDEMQDHEAQKREYEKAIEELMPIDGINEDLADRLFDAGYKSVKDIAEADPDELQKVKGIGKKNCETIQDSADEILDAQEAESGNEE